MEFHYSKSFHMSLWPVYIVILNTPPLIHYNAANTILVVLWCGPEKAQMELLFHPVVDILNTLLMLKAGNPG